MSNGNYFNIFEKIQDWGKSLENWERLALLQLSQKGSVEENDIKLIYEEFKIDKGLIQAPAERKNYDLNNSFIPQSIQQAQPLILSQIGEIKGVNAIVDGQTLCCGPKLTVVYGPNGSGKSGYARILKAACFTRSPFTTIHGNVNFPSTKRQRPSANFTFADSSSVVFSYGIPCPQLRDNFAVFDTSCIRVCIDSKNDFKVNPYGFDVFPGLVDVIAKVKRLLEDEIQKRTPNFPNLQISGSLSEVAALLNNLSRNSDLQKIKELSVFGPTEENKLIELIKQLDEFNKKDPSLILREKRLNGKDIKHLIRKLCNMGKLIDPLKHENIRKSIDEVKRLREVALAASAAQFGNEPVQPVGTEAWRALIEAAIKYNNEAFPNKSFPVDSEDTRCVLCQQPLSTEAKVRLSKFLSFVRSEAENNLKKGLTKIVDLQKELDIVDLDFFRNEATGYRTIESYDKKLVDRIKRYIDAAMAIRKGLVSNLRQEKWEATSAVQESPIKSCEDLRIKLAQEIRILRKQGISKQKKQLEIEIQLLSDRQQLKRIISNVEEAIINLRWLDKAYEQKRLLHHKHVTDKQKALAKELVGKGFIEQFKIECDSLGLKLLIKVNISGSEAVTCRSLIVGEIDEELPDPSQILSEGEQTAVALADFLTEIGLNKHPIGIIFDDPVNSMDHIRKEMIAKRLVEEATKRQVIIFTHDIIFTHHLAEAAEKAGADKVKFTACTISTGLNSTPGYVNKTVFPHIHYEKESEKLAELYLTEAKNLSGTGQKEKLELGCGALRAAYENFIQRQLFNDVVNRWREPIMATALSKIYFDQAVIDSVVEHYELLSRYEKGHSHSPEFHEVPLDMAFLAKEIIIFKEIKKKYCKAAQDYKDKKSEEKKSVFS